MIHVGLSLPLVRVRVFDSTLRGTGCIKTAERRTWMGQQWAWPVKVLYELTASCSDIIS